MLLEEGSPGIFAWLMTYPAVYKQPSVWQMIIGLALIAFLQPLNVAGKCPSDTSRIIRSFVVVDGSGRISDVARLKNKVIFINFWSLTCAPCKAEMPTIDNLANHYRNDSDFYIYPVDLDHNFFEDTRYFKEKGFSLNFFAPAGVVPQEIFKGELPTTIVLDKKRKIVFFHPGEEKYDTPAFYEFIDSLLKR